MKGNQSAGVTGKIDVMPNQIYVIGHVNPDTDSIASAMGYAWLLRERDGVECRRRARGRAQPAIGVGAQDNSASMRPSCSPMRRRVLNRSCSRLDSIRPDSQLGAAWTLASKTGGIAPVVDEDGKPYGIINGLSLFKYFTRDARSAARRYHRARDDVRAMQRCGGYKRAEISRQRAHPRFSQPHPAR